MPEAVTLPHPDHPNAEQHPGHGPEDQSPQHADDERLRIVLTSLDNNVDAFAREAAHEKLSEKVKGSLWKRFSRNAWNAATREYAIVKETTKAREAIRASGNLRHFHGESDEAWREAVVTRQSSEYHDKLVHEGETFHNHTTP
jgi:hypothetical protein